MPQQQTGLPDDLDADRLLHLSGRLDLADKAAMLADQIQTLQTSRDVVRAHHRQHLPHFSSKEDDMQIVLGDINYAPPVNNLPESQSQSSHDPALPTKTLPRKAGALAKLALGGAMLATGAGAGVGIPLLLSGGKELVAPTPDKAQTPAPTAPTQQHGWTLELGQ